MPIAQNYYPECPEPFLVSLARTGDRMAFAELVRRRQSWVRNLMRRCCNDPSLADDLAQQVFLKVWLSIRKLREVNAFGAWLKRVSVTVWLKHVRKNDALRGAGELSGTEAARHDSTSVAMDLNDALAVLSDPVRLCVVLSYDEGMSHREIAELTELPLGTVKSHIRLGARRLQEILSDYSEDAGTETS